MGSEIEASYEVPASCYAPCIPFDKLSAQSTFQELVGIVKSPNHLEMKVHKASYNEIGSSAHFFDRKSVSLSFLRSSDILSKIKILFFIHSHTVVLFRHATLFYRSRDHCVTSETRVTRARDTERIC